MSASRLPLGQNILGISRLGDDLTTLLYPRSNALALSYTLAPSQFALPLPITYTIQKPHVAPLLLYYLITPVTNFAINGDGSIIAPDRVTPVLPPVAGRTLTAAPLLQGFPQIAWQYTALSWSEWQALIAHYDPNNTVVTITYPDETGFWVQRQAVMHPPSYGEMSTVLILNATLSFSILPS
jgi:hypothetical protein